MKIFVIGSGEIGTHIAQQLSNQKHEVVIFEINDSRFNLLSDSIDAKVINNDGSSAKVLFDSGISDCDIFFAVTSDNNINLVSCSIAKKLGASKAICRVHPSLLQDETLMDYRSNFSIDYIFSPERLSAVELAKHIRNPDAIMVEEIARGKIAMQHFEIKNNKIILDKSLKEIKLPERVRIGAISNNDQTRIPNADDTISDGDILTIFGSPENMKNAFSALGLKKIKKEEKNIVIFSGSDYGFSLATILEGIGVKTRIIEKNTKKCEQLSKMLKKTTIINADATSLNVLKEENVSQADFLIACSLKDEDNVMTCIQAHNLGTKNCLTIIHRADYADAIRSSEIDLGIIGAVSPREATNKEIARFITTQKYHLIREFHGGELIEFYINHDSSLINKKISEIDWPKSCIIVAQIQGIESRIPSPNDIIQNGDALYAVVDKAAKKTLIKII